MIDRWINKTLGLLALLLLIGVSLPYIRRAFVVAPAEISRVFQDIGFPIDQMDPLLIICAIPFVVGCLVRLLRWRQNQGEARYRTSQQRRIRRSPRRSTGDVPLNGRRKRRKDPDPPLRF